MPAFEGQITHLIDLWTKSEAAEYEFLQMLVEKDEGGRTPLDIACF